MKHHIGNMSCMLSLALILCSCGTFHNLAERDYIQISTISDRILNSGGIPNIEDATEREMIDEGIEALLVYMARKESVALLDGMENIKVIGDFRNWIIESTGLTPMEIGLEAFMYWDNEVRFDYSGRKMKAFETDHFIIYAYEGTKADEDMNGIASLFERYLDELFLFIGREKNLFYRNLNLLEKGKIIVELPPDSKNWPGFNSTARMSIGIYTDGRDEKRFTIKIEVPYYNTLSCAVITHEVTHMVDFMLKIDFSIMTDVKIAEMEEVWNRILRETMPHDTPIGEGFAEYTSKNFNLFQKLFLLSPEERLKAAQNRELFWRRTVRNAILTSSTSSLNRRERLMQYTELHSIVAYLIERYGKERFLDFYFSLPLDEDNFIRHYGKTFQETEIEWKEYYGF